MLYFTTFKNKADAKGGRLKTVTADECFYNFPGCHTARRAKDGEAFTIAHYKNIDSDGSVHRISSNITGSYGIVFDIDSDEEKGSYSPDEAHAIFKEWQHIIYTTHSHKLEYPRFRIILFFDDIVAKEKWNMVYKHFREMMPAHVPIDDASGKISNQWYFPACPSDKLSVATIKKHKGKLIPVGKIIEDLEVIYVTHSILDQENNPVRDNSYPRSQEENNTTFPNVNTKFTNLVGNNKGGISLRNITNPLTDINEDLEERVIRVLEEPAMYVGNFGYEGWVKIGAAIKGSNLPWDIFNEWSSRDQAKYDGLEKNRKKWSELPSGATAGSIFSIAEDKGILNWQGRAPKEKKYKNNIIPMYPVKMERMPDTPDSEEEYTPRIPDDKERGDFPLELCDSAPENIKRYMDYQLSTTDYPNPVFALASAISTMGFLYHQRIAAEYQFCSTNMYILTLGYSGQGKGHAFRCSRTLFDRLGLTHNIDSTPESEPGLITALRRLDGNMHLLIDEFDQSFIHPMVNKNSSSYITKIGTLCTRLYSETAQPFLPPNSKAREEDNNKGFIPNPHLSIFGACIHSEFYKYYGGVLAKNGFLARMMTFCNLDYEPDQVRNYKSYKDVPSKLLNLTKGIISEKIIDINRLNMEVKPRLIGFENTSTKDYHADCVDHWKKKARRLSKSKDEKDIKIGTIYNRLCENALKIALSAHEGDTISRSVWEWAMNVSEALDNNIIYTAIREAPENKWDSGVKKMERIILEAKGWISVEQLTNRFRHSLKEREDILGYLLEAKKIATRQVQTPKSKRPTTQYMAI